MQMTGLKGARLSLQQERLWALPGTKDAYRVQGMVSLRGELNAAAFYRVLQQMVEQHEILHTAFNTLAGMDVPVQILQDHCEVDCSEIDLRGIAVSTQKTLFDECCASLRQAAFDLAQGPLVRTALFCLSAEEHLFLVDISAWCADSPTLPLLVAELSRRYEACCRNVVFDDEILQYIDISAWQNQMLSSESAEIGDDLWRKRDISRLAQLPLPFERDNGGVKRVSPEEFVPRTLPVALEEGLSESLQELAHRRGVSVPAILLACWQILLWRFTDTPDLVIGVACDGRPYEEMANILGLYTRFLPVESSFEENWTFERIVSAVDLALNEATQWQTYFTWASSSQSPRENPPVFPLTFEYNRSPNLFRAGLLTFSLLRLYGCTEPFALKLYTLQVGEHLQLELHYDARYITTEQTLCLALALRTVLGNVVKRPQEAACMIKILGAAEQERMLSQYHAPSTSLPAQGLHQLFERQVLAGPTQPAVIDAQGTLTYQELNTRANQLARLLRKRGVSSNTLVGLCFTRSAHMLVGLLAILKAGGAYVPLDPESPSARLAYQLEDMQASLLLTQQALLPRLSSWNGQTLCLEAIRSEMERESSANLSLVVEGDSLAYVMYTSGSTGVPKGVMIRQQSVVNYVMSLCQLLDAKPGLQYATVSTLAADLGNTAIFCALVSGGCIQVLDYEVITSGEALARWVDRHPIDILKVVPSHLSALLAGEQADKLLPRQALVLGGEALPSRLLERLRALGSNMAVYNHYGPTETTIGVLVNALGVLPARDAYEAGEERGIVPLGRPIASTAIYVLDRHLQVLPAGIVGELFVGGGGLALGYLHQPEQTAERFIPHPFSRQPGARLYRTGDLVRTTLQGQIEFVGRRDGQVKLRGYRIEAGEVETVLRQHLDVWDCAVILREDMPGEKQLVGYVVPQKQPAPAQKDLQSFLRERLPDYMVPPTFLFLKDLPLTANGKVDRQRLPAPEPRLDDEQSPLDAPRGPVEEILLEIWKELLAIPSIGIHENFFQLGGHSLLATQVISRVRAVLQVETSVLDLFEAPTIAGQARRMEQALRGEQRLEFPGLVPVSREQRLPLSFAQQRLWFLDQLEPDSVAYLIKRTWQLRGSLSMEIAERCFTELVRRHESLRTTFHMNFQEGQPVQIIHPVERFHLPLLDLSGLEQEKHRYEVLRLVGLAQQQPFNLERFPLLRAFILRLDREMHMVIVTMHHIISDGWSNRVFIHEIMALYQAFEVGQPSPLSPLPIQYADFAVWQRQWLQGQVLEAQLAYWRSQLADITPLELPTDHPRPSVQTYRGASRFLWLPVSLRDDLIALGQRENVTLFMLLLAAFQVVLSRYTGQKSISIGTPVANRTHIELEGLIGFFVNTLVLRTDFSDNPSFVEVLKQVRAVSLGAYAHQDVPFEQLVELLQPGRDLSRSPLFQIFFSVEVHAIAQRMTGWEVSPAEREGGRENEATKFDLEFLAVSTNRGVRCEIEYSKDLFEAGTIRRLLFHLQVLLESIVANPDQRIASLPLLTPAERSFLLEECNATQRDYPLQKSFIHLFAEQVARTAYDIAAVCGEVQLTYRELELRANRLARSLRAVGVGPETLVGLYMERSLELLIAILGVFKAGGAYVPLDPAAPSQRTAFTLQDARVGVVITQSALQASLPAIPGTIIALELDEPVTEETLEEQWLSAYHPDQLAYVIYTSGSTGLPKGAMVTQSGMLNHLLAKIETLQIQSGDTIAQTASHCFDISVWQFLALLLVGGKVQIFPDEVTHDPLSLFAQISTARISILEVVPSLLRAFLDMLEQQACEETVPEKLRWLVVTGEQLLADTGLRWIRRYPGVQLLNAYGPTECSDDVTHALLSLDSLDGKLVAPIGRALANTQIYLLDEHLETVPVGVYGEIYVGGAGVGRGYLGDAVRSAQVFVPNPFDNRAGSRLYKTGDIGRYHEDGQIEFIRRVDQQIKVRGYRIEPGEIEAAISACGDVDEAAVLWRETSQGEGKLIGYVVWRAGQVEEPEQRRRMEALQDYLQGRLPQYMLPSSWVELEELPLNRNGKLDRERLPEPAEPGAIADRIESPGQVEEVVQMLWRAVLGKEAGGNQESFFEQGGHSLLATQLVARMRAVFQIEVGVRMIFEEPTIQREARWVERALREQRGIKLAKISPVERKGDLPLSFAQQRLWFLAQLEPESVAYLVPQARSIHGSLDVAVLRQCFLELIKRHESLRTTFPAKKGQPVQLIHRVEDVSCSLPVIDLQGLLPDEREIQAHALVEQEKQTPCDLVRGPLLRLSLLRLGSQEHMLLITLHHIITDGWSNEVFYRELFILYHAFVRKLPSPLAPLPIQYADYAVWQRQQLQGEALEIQLGYWTGQLGGAPPLALPLDRPRPVVRSQRGAVHHFVLDRELSGALVTLSNQHNVTLFMTLLAAFKVLLYRYSGQLDVVAGTDSANRNSLEVEGIIGFFINLLVLRTNLSGKPSFSEVVQRVRKTVLDAYTYQETPFELLVEKLVPDHSLAHLPFIQALFVMQNIPSQVGESSGAAAARSSDDEGKDEAVLEQSSDAERASKFDLALFVSEHKGRIYGAFHYSKDVFEAKTVALMAARFIVLLQSIVAQPDVSIDALNFFTSAEWEQQQQTEKALLNRISRNREKQIVFPEIDFA